MNIPRRALFGKLNTDLFRAIESATAFAKLRGNPYVEMVHWLHQIWQISGNDFHRIAQHYGVDAAQVEKDLTIALAQLPGGASGINDFSHLIESSIERAWVFSSLSMGDKSIRGAWLMAAILQTPDLRRVLLGISASFQKIPPLQVGDDFPLIISGSLEDSSAAHESTDLSAAIPGEASGALEPLQDGKSALAKYCSDLTALAREGQIDPVIGREHEIRTMVDTGHVMVDITFESMDDFSPAAVANKVDALKQLLDARTQLSNLQTYMDGKAGAEDLVRKLLSDPALMKSLAATPKPAALNS